MESQQKLAVFLCLSASLLFDLIVCLSKRIQPNAKHVDSYLFCSEAVNCVSEWKIDWTRMRQTKSVSYYQVNCCFSRYCLVNVSRRHGFRFLLNTKHCTIQRNCNICTVNCFFLVLSIIYYHRTTGSHSIIGRFCCSDFRWIQINFRLHLIIRTPKLISIDVLIICFFFFRVRIDHCVFEHSHSQCVLHVSVNRIIWSAINSIY